MRSPLPACFRERSGDAPTPSAAVHTPTTTSSYETNLGVVSLTWSRSLFALSLTINIDKHNIEIIVKQYPFYKQKGSKRFHIGSREVKVAWDMSHATFTSRNPEPYGGHFLIISVDSETVLAVGDITNKKMKKLIRLGTPTLLVSRKEEIVFAGGMYRTRAVFGGREREVSIEMKDMGMTIAFDGQTAIHVRQIRWMFRGSQVVDMEGGVKVRMSWDLHNWLFQKQETENGAVFAFRFEGERLGFMGGELSGSKEWSGSSDSVGGRRKRLIKASSFSSTTSTGSVSTVTEWESAEEAEMRSAEGFTLMVYAWKR